MPRFNSIRASFRLKPVAALALAALADALFWQHAAGSTLGAFAGVLVVTAALLHPAIARDRRAALALLAATAFAAVLADRPTLLAASLFCVAIAVAALSPRAPAGEDAWRWLQRLVVAAVAGLFRPLLDWRKARRLRRRRGGRRRSWLVHIPQLLLPAVGGAVFLALFAFANPLIWNALTEANIPAFDLGRAMFWMGALLGAWMLLRPRSARWPAAQARARSLERPGVTVLSVGLSLVLFNALFAVENGLDLVFLWSGAALPRGVTLAGYAHRGAYTLIATAILAGAFVLFALRPGASTARSRPLRALVVLWVAQNLLLVASSVLRTLDYVQAYCLTAFRIAALIWMGLVAIGLVLICWRLLRGKSSSWLVNANVLAAALVLTGCSVVDLGAVAAAWNVRHAAEVGGAGASLDVDYLRRLGPAALVPMTELVRRPLPQGFRDQVDTVRVPLLADMRRRQGDWHGWTWRDQRRLDRAEALTPNG